MVDYTEEGVAAFLVKKFNMTVAEDSFRIFAPATSGYVLQLRYPPGHTYHKIKYFDSSCYEDITNEAKDAEFFSELFPVVIAALAKQENDSEIKCLIIKVKPVE